MCQELINKEEQTISQFTVIQIEINDLECLKQALKDLDYSYDEDPTAPVLTQSTYSDGQRPQKSHLTIKSKGRLRQIYKTDQDKWVASRADASWFKTEITPRYGVKKIEKQIKQMGFVITERKTQKNGSMKIKVLA